MTVSQNIRKRLAWKKTDNIYILTLDGKDVMSLHPQYWLKWSDGVFSADHYNLSRAKQHAMDEVCKKYELEPTI